MVPPHENLIRLSVPYFDEQAAAEIAAVLRTGYLTQGRKVEEFEGRIAEMIGSRHAFATSSCTTALHLALVAAGVRPGDEVIVSDFTFPATANVVVQQGARPVFVDIRKDTYNLDPSKLEQSLSDRTKAVIPVHAFGLSCEMEPIVEFCRLHNLTLIEDAACALAGRYKGRFCGTMGDMGCFSFHPRKSITTGEGGMIVTDSDALAGRIGLLRSHGGVRGDFYSRFEAAGFNYRLSDLLAALGLTQLDKLDRIVEAKRAWATLYTSQLESMEELDVPREPETTYHPYQSYVVLLRKTIARDKILKEMRLRNVECTLGTYALHAQPFFAESYGYRPGELAVSYEVYQQSVSLPLYADLTNKEVQHVVAALKECLSGSRRYGSTA